MGSTGEREEKAAGQNNILRPENNQARQERSVFRKRQDLVRFFAVLRFWKNFKLLGTICWGGEAEGGMRVALSFPKYIENYANKKGN